MANLKDKFRQIPNGLRFFEPITGWDSTKVLGTHPSLDRLTDAVVAHRMGNPRYKSKWATDRAGVTQDVEQYNVALCKANGWNDYITDGSVAPPKFRPPTSRPGAGVAGASRRASAGIKLVVEWLGEGLKPVSIDIAEQRAAVCVKCPKNEDGGFFEKIGALAAQQVKDLIEVRNDLALKTKHDGQLKSCSACSCWLPLKVFAVKEHVQKYTSEEVRERLDPSCWILAEAKQ